MAMKDRIAAARANVTANLRARAGAGAPSGRRFGANTVLVLVTAVVLVGELLGGNAGCVEVNPGQVLVVYNNTGWPVFGDRQKTIVEQGARSFIPGVHTALVLERRPQILVMAGMPGQQAAEASADDEHNRVKALTVRANDGSNFYFDGLEVHYQIIAADAGRAIETSGPGESYKVALVKTHVREILRDEFGAYGFLEIADPTSYGAASAEAKRRLNERLNPYGIEVTQIITPKPKFDPRVEKAIEDRQSAEQDVSVQEEKRNKLEQEKGLKIQGVEQQKSQEYQQLLGELEAKKMAANNQLLTVKREADKYFIDNDASGAAYLDEKLTRAKAAEVSARKEAEGLVQKITAVGAQGPDVLNSVIADKIFPQLKRVSGTPLIKPASATAIDVRHIGAGVADAGGGGGAP